MEYGRKGVELLKEIVHHDVDSLSAYNEDLVRTVITEVKEHNAQTIRITQQYESADSQVVSSDAWSDNLDAAAAVVVHIQCAIRNKKLLLAYMLQRVERLKNIRWSQKALPTSTAINCSPQELEFYKGYDRLLSRYMSKDNGIGLDLTLDIRPPKANNVLVKVLESQGDMMFSFGQASLMRGTLHLLPVEEAEPLIREGAVKMVHAGNGY
ncbi:hypothetical protein CEUSTIGMA_g2946.t1 [Chlamydomonas eustigma]|uniref:GINS subunit domain-containing protein n=1 Tax=Chlamydomonas eustigma TaxID=1157962 RepID=A0A250WXD5_9CHLO|nr:hypothetical protein CEUSTIGMA_g2946.t1 [Chlamydomonas eustigma]|eukprot:GAX75503.1 hypothetical protein CEUSTIGMA_g2946.t1 [Chlamydomonas eustigma]